MRLIGYFIVLLWVFTPLTAHALSCAPPVLDKELVKSSSIIFEGTVQKSRALNMLEKTKRFIKKRGGDKSNLLMYEFIVTRAWKGVKIGDIVKVLRNTYWGDEFRVDGTIYLAIGLEKEHDYYRAHLCGATNALQYYKNNRQINVLKGIFGEEGN